tara:strand:+ start:188 stop:523 length:336 start_codon:yes stop_codon:yes gene_type:complete
MKKILTSFLLSLIASSGASANSAVLGLGLDSCAKVIENVEKNEDLGAAFKTAYTSYVMGFFSGVNVVYEDDTGLEGFEGLYSEVLANCKAAPDASFIAAIINLYAELKNKS